MSDLFNYRGKRVVVTGAFSGVGASLVELLSELGAEHITVLDIKKPSGPSDVFLEVDLSDPAALDAAAAEIAGPVHALFNNAGVAANAGARKVLSINYLAARRLSEALADRMPAGSAITQTASMAGNGWGKHFAEINELLDIADWDAALAWVDAHGELIADPYGFSKEVVQVHTLRSSHATIARGVRTNSVCPAAIDTPLLVDFKATMTEKVINWQVREAAGRLCTAAESANALAFLGSDAASYINGINLLVDNGFNAAMATGQVDFTGLA